MGVSRALFFRIGEFPRDKSYAEGAFHVEHDDFIACQKHHSGDPVWCGGDQGGRAAPCRIAPGGVDAGAGALGVFRAIAVQETVASPGDCGRAR